MTLKERAIKAQELLDKQEPATLEQLQAQCLRGKNPKMFKEIFGDDYSKAIVIARKRLKEIPNEYKKLYEQFGQEETDRDKQINDELYKKYPDKATLTTMEIRAYNLQCINPELFEKHYGSIERVRPVFCPNRSKQYLAIVKEYEESKQEPNGVQCPN